MNRWTDGVFFVLAGLLLAIGHTAAVRTSLALEAKGRPVLGVALHILRLGLIAAAIAFMAHYSRVGMFVTAASFAVGQIVVGWILQQREIRQPRKP